MCLRRNLEFNAGPRRPGFSLIELLVVVAIMAVLISLLVPSLSLAREDAHRTVCLANLKQIGAGLFTYAATNREDGPQVMTPIVRTAPRQLLSAPGGMVNLGLAWPKRRADAQQYRCPSQRNFAYPTDLARLGQDYVAGSYAYAIHVPAGQSPRLGAIRHLALVSDDYTAGADHLGVGRDSHRVGYNVLYTDGSVNWYGDATGSIWKRRIYWDNETDDVTYATFYSMRNPAVQTIEGAGGQGGTYSNAYDLFKVWWSFCYRRPNPFPNE